MFEPNWYQMTLQILFLLLTVVLAFALVLFVRFLRYRQSAIFFEDILEQGNLPRQILGTGNRILWSNKAAQRFTGGKKSTIPATIREVFEGDPGSVEKQRYLEEQSNQGKYAVSLFKCHEGLAKKLGFTTEGEGVIIVGASPILQDGGGALWSIGFLPAHLIHDIFEAEREPALKLLDAFSLGYYALDEKGRIGAINDTFAKWLGIEKNGPTVSLPKQGLSVKDILWTSQADSEQSTLLVKDVEKGRGLVTLKSRNGELLNVVVSEQKISKTPSGNIQAHGLVKYLGLYSLTGQAMEGAELRVERFIQETPIAIVQFSFDDNNSIQDANPAFCKLIDKTRQEIIGEKFTNCVVKKEEAKFREEIVAFKKSLTSTEAEFKPTPLEVSLYTNPVKICSMFLNVYEDEVGNPLHIIAYILDTTEQKSLETQFVQSQKMQAVGQLAGGIAHDFNNLLTAMIGFSDLLLLRHRPGDPSFPDIMQIKQNANRAANLVRQLLAFSRQQSLQPKVLSLTDILTELSHLLRRLIGETIELEVAHGRDLWQIKADQGQLEQVIINLAVNARDAMPNGGHLEIHTANRTVDTPILNKGEDVPPGDYTVLEVRDAGCGIAGEYMDRIFDPFFSTKEVGEGTGLGLSTVYGIVKQTGGYILVDSKVGAGTGFTVLLPRYLQTQASVGEEEVENLETRDLTGMGTILLVEDEDAVRTFAARTLKNKGYHVIEARSGEEALQILTRKSDAADPGRRHPNDTGPNDTGPNDTGPNDTAKNNQPNGFGQNIDLLITDVVMPKMDGGELAKRVMEIYPEMKIIFISGYAEETFRSRLGEAEDVSFLPKPFNLKQLAATVKKAMRQ